MNPDLKLLIELQRLDSRIGELTMEIHRLPRKIAELESQLSGHIRDVEQGKERLAENQRSRRKREGDITALREKISRYRDQTMEVKTNEQYRALLHEIEFLELEIVKHEEEILQEMIDSEGIEQHLREAEQSLSAERARIEAEIAEARKKKEVDEKEAAVFQAQRQEVRQQLPASVYGRYERIAALRKGWAVAAVGEGTCGACHVMLRPQAFNDVKTNETILTCESCDRILYYAPPPPPPEPSPG